MNVIPLARNDSINSFFILLQYFRIPSDISFPCLFLHSGLFHMKSGSVLINLWCSFVAFAILACLVFLTLSAYVGFVSSGLWCSFVAFAMLARFISINFFFLFLYRLFRCEKIFFISAGFFPSKFLNMAGGAPFSTGNNSLSISFLVGTPHFSP